MSSWKVVPIAAVAAAAAAAGVSLASGGPPPTQPPDPPAHAVIVPGSGRADVHKPGRRTDTTIQRAVAAARHRAMAPAMANALEEARALARLAGMGLGRPVGVQRDAPPVGYWDDSTGRFGPGKWCGRIVTSRWVRRADGTRRRRTRSRYGCRVPNYVELRVTVTFAADSP